MRLIDIATERRVTVVMFTIAVDARQLLPQPGLTLIVLRVARGREAPRGEVGVLFERADGGNVILDEIEDVSFHGGGASACESESVGPSRRAWRTPVPRRP